jgi:hypothetical protein
MECLIHGADFPSLLIGHITINQAFFIILIQQSVKFPKKIFSESHSKKAGILNV